MVSHTKRLLVPDATSAWREPFLTNAALRMNVNFVLPSDCGQSRLEKALLGN